MKTIPTIDEMGDELCSHCELTEFGHRKVNTGPHNLCEGALCNRTYERYVEALEDEIDEA